MSGEASSPSVRQRPLPEPDEESAPYWRAAAEHVLTVARCADCDKAVVPPDLVCPHCHSVDPRYRFVPVGGAGVIRSWTTIRQALLPGFDVPFVLVDVELDDAPELRMIGRLLDGADVQLHVGARVEVDFEDLAPDIAVPAFRLAVPA